MKTKSFSHLAIMTALLLSIVSCKKTPTEAKVDNPVVSTGNVINISSNGATIGGNVASSGGATVSARGVCYATTQNPTTSGMCVSSGNGIGSFSASLTNLSAGTTYFARAFATNSSGTAYGAQLEFRTSVSLPTVSTGTVTAITSTSAAIAGEVTASGSATVTSRGVCYSTTQNPTTGGTCVASGDGLGSFSVTVSSLPSGTQYFVRAYATSSAGTAYGAQAQFTTTAALPTVSTGSVNAVTVSGASVAGNVSATGGSTVTERGVCYSTSENPSLSGTCVSASGGTGSFTVTLSGLSAGTKYYVRAYATNGVGTSYGGQSDFTTRVGLPTVTTGSVTNLTSTSATVSGNVTNSGGATVTDRGVCYSWQGQNIINSFCSSAGSGTGSFSVNISDLNAAVTYTVKAYAKNSAGTAYGAELELTTPVDLPSVSTGLISNISSSGATISGNVTNSGGGTIIARGVCWSTTQNPTTSNACLISGSGTGAFTATISGLSAGVTYFVRTFATNSIGTAYGSQISFTTIGLPTVKTGTVSAISSTGATVAGEVTATGGTTVTGRGVCWSLYENPTLSTTSGSACAASGTGTGSFSVNITGLTAGVTYFVRAYATNTIGTSYGLQSSFSTMTLLPTVSTGVISAITHTSATINGQVTGIGASSVTSRGVCRAITQNPDISNSGTNSCLESGTGIGTYAVTFTDLRPGLTYFVRAYATNSAGTSYGVQTSFTALPLIFGTVTDVDGNVYKTVQIGTQFWMTSGLRTTSYRNADIIPNVTSNSTWGALTTGAWRVPNEAYGNLYNWYAVADSRNICPTGWHVPTDSDWDLLKSFLGTDAGYKMKTQSGWSDGNGSNIFGYNGLPGGKYPSESPGLYSYFWSISSRDASSAWYRVLAGNSRELSRNVANKKDGLSVRCVRD